MKSIFTIFLFSLITASIASPGTIVYTTRLNMLIDVTVPVDIASPMRREEIAPRLEDARM